MRKLFLLAVLAWGIALIMLYQVSSEAYADSLNIEIVAVVQPVRIIVVNKSQEIIEITDNTDLSVEPQVLQSTLKGKQVEYTSQIAEQYEHLMKSARLSSKVGVIYTIKQADPVAVHRGGKTFNLVSILPMEVSL